MYKTYPKGTKISLAVLQKSLQIIKHDTDLLLMVDTAGPLTNEDDHFNPHLLFFNKSNKLYSACYFSSEYIDSIKNNYIFAILNEDRNKRISAYRNDLPSKYKIDFRMDPFGNGAGTNPNTVRIDSIAISNDLEVKLYIHSFPQDTNVNATWNLMMGDTSFFKKYTIPDVLTFKLEQLYFNQPRIISLRKIVDGKATGWGPGLRWEEMIVRNQSTLDSFYVRLFKILNK